MTLRYFYTDPLSAAYMAKHFGMKLKCLFKAQDDGIGQNEVGTPYPFEHAVCEAEMWGDVIQGACRRIYMQADSLPLLEPQVGDIVTAITGGNAIQPGMITEEGVLWAGSRERDTLDGHEPIIQRNGLAFHWPESEAP